MFIAILALILVLLIKLYKNEGLLKNFLTFKSGSKKTKVGLSKEAVKFYKLFILTMIILASWIIFKEMFSFIFHLINIFS